MNRMQWQRLAWRTAFFALFVFAPVLDLFRYDLTQGHFILFGYPWTLAIDPAHPWQSSINIIVRAFLPIASLVGIGFWVSWHYGRLYCGWLCPHFSVVEMINSLMRRASGKPTLWEAEALPEQQSDGVEIHPPRSLWWRTPLAILFFKLPDRVGALRIRRQVGVRAARRLLAAHLAET